MPLLHVVRAYPPHPSCTAPLILLHGIGGSGRVWDVVIERTSRHRLVVCPDLLGFGESKKPDAKYDIDDHIAALEEALARELQGPFEIAGHSLGGVLALEFAARHTSQCVAVTVLSMPYFASSTEAEETLCRKWMGRMLLRHVRIGRLLCFVICQHSHVWQPLLRAAAGRSVPTEVVTDSTKHTFDSFSRTLRACIVDHRVDGAAEHLYRFRVPLRVVHGTKDSTVPLARARAFVSRFPDASFETVEGASHMAPLSMLEWTENLLSCLCDRCDCCDPGQCTC